MRGAPLPNGSTFGPRPVGHGTCRSLRRRRGGAAVRSSAERGRSALEGGREGPGPGPTWPGGSASLAVGSGCTARPRPPQPGSGPAPRVTSPGAPGSPSGVRLGPPGAAPALHPEPPKDSWWGPFQPDPGLGGAAARGRAYPPPQPASRHLGRQAVRSGHPLVSPLHSVRPEHCANARGPGVTCHLPVPGQLPICSALATPYAPPWMESLFLVPLPNLPKASLFFSLQRGHPEPTTLPSPALGTRALLTRTVHPSQSPISRGARGGGTTEPDPQAPSARRGPPGPGLSSTPPPLASAHPAPCHLRDFAWTVHLENCTPALCLPHFCPALVQCHFLGDAAFSPLHLLKERPLCPGPCFVQIPPEHTAQGGPWGRGFPLLPTVLAKASP